MFQQIGNHLFTIAGVLARGASKHAGLARERAMRFA
jgi:hypothetical protein